MSSIIIDNTKEASVSGVWSNPGASLYDSILEDTNWQSLLKETYLIAPIGRINNTPHRRTTFSSSGVGYPHHIIRGSKLVVHLAGLQAAFSRAKQQGIFRGTVAEHLIRHYKELELYEESSISDDIQHREVEMFMRNETLRHHGILGMRWGFRRERGPDGRVRGPKVPTDEFLRTQQSRAQPTETLSNAELKSAVERLNLEKQFRELTKKQVGPGRKFVTDVLTGYGKSLAMSQLNKWATPAVESMFQKLFMSGGPPIGPGGPPIPLPFGPPKPRNSGGGNP